MTARGAFGRALEAYAQAVLAASAHAAMTDITRRADGRVAVRGTILDILSQRGKTTVVLQEGASRVCATGGQCLELTQPGETDGMMAAVDGAFQGAETAVEGVISVDEAGFRVYENVLGVLR